MRTTLSIGIAFAALASCLPAFAQERPRPAPGTPGTVTLSLAEYDRLVDRAAKSGVRPEPPPIEAVVSRGEFRARVDGSLVRGTLRLDGEVFRSGAARIPLVDGATLFDARSDGRALPVVHDGDAHAAVLSGPAPFSAVLDWGVALETTPGRASFVMPAAQAGSVSATIDLPGDLTDVRVVPGLITRRQSASGRTQVDVTLQPGARAHVSWDVRESAQAPAAEARMLADVKSLWRIGDADVQLVSLVEITMIRGDARTFELRLPPGFEPSSITGGSLDTSDTKGSVVTLTVREGGDRRHQFLVSAERAHEAGPFRLDAPLPTVASAQRETGEVAIEGGGTIEVTAAGDEALRRMDVREINASLRSLSQEPLLAAFRYQRRPGETRALSLDVKRFPDAPVIAAVADRATAMTLVTTEGRMLTEVMLWLRNRAQPFVKVTLPPGATMLSVDVAGESARPVQGSDGTRVPLLRPGFRPDGPYEVSFVYLHAGTPFEKKGEARMALASIDLPVTLLEWEVFVPDRYSVKTIGGNVIPGEALRDIRQPDAIHAPPGIQPLGGTVAPGRAPMAQYETNMTAGPGDIVGHVADASGYPLPGATVTLVGGPGGRTRQTAVTDASGVYILRNVPAGQVTIVSELAGFRTARQSIGYNLEPRSVDLVMQVSSVGESVTVAAEPLERAAKTEEPQQASQNVLNLQRRVAGVLPVRIDVPRTGTSHRFVRPLVLGDQTEVSLKYKRR